MAHNKRADLAGDAYPVLSCTAFLRVWMENVSMSTFDYLQEMPVTHTSSTKCCSKDQNHVQIYLQKTLKRMALKMETTSQILPFTQPKQDLREHAWMK